MPTILDILIINHNLKFDGLNIFEKSNNRFLLSEAMGFKYEEKALIYGKYKVIYSEYGNVRWLFDLEKDPGEIHNLIDEPSRRDEVEKWRGYLVKELGERNCGWVKDGKPFCPSKEPLVSPYKDVRWDGRK